MEFRTWFYNLNLWRRRSYSSKVEVIEHSWWLQYINKPRTYCLSNCFLIIVHYSQSLLQQQSQNRSTTSSELCETDQEAKYKYRFAYIFLSTQMEFSIFYKVFLPLEGKYLSTNFQLWSSSETWRIQFAYFYYYIQKIKKKLKAEK